MAIFSRDPRDLGSWAETTLLDPGDPGSSTRMLSWDPTGLGSHKTTTSLYFEHPLHPMEFASGSPYLCAALTSALLIISATH